MLSFYLLFMNVIIFVLPLYVILFGCYNLCYDFSYYILQPLSPLFFRRKTWLTRSSYRVYTHRNQLNFFLEHVVDSKSRESMSRRNLKCYIRPTACMLEMLPITFKKIPSAPELRCNEWCLQHDILTNWNPD